MELNNFTAIKGCDFARRNTQHSPMFLAMDLGSTETRSLVFNSAGESQGLIHLDSNYAILSRGIDHIGNPDDELSSKLEAVIIDRTAGNKTEAPFSKVHVVKGKLRNVADVHVVNTTANASKIDQDPTYINCVFNTAYMLLLRSAAMGALPEATVPVDITVSMPPEDTISQNRIDRFKSRLAGQYQVTFPRLDSTIQFEIKAEDITVISEPNAVAIYQQGTDPLDQESAFGFIDIGGRSAGYSFVRGGVLLEDNCVTEPVGGNTMQNIIATLVADKLNIHRPTNDVVNRALKTGNIKIGSRMIDISSCINAAKQEIASTLFNGFTTAMDSNNLQAQQLSKIFCSGRSFGVSQDEGGIKSPSLMNALEGMFRLRSPYTDFQLIDSQDAIVTGLMYARLCAVE